MKNVFFLAVAAALSFNLIADPMKPEKKDDWAELHSREAEKMKGSVVPVLFLGDSITAGWKRSKDIQYPGGLEVWNARFLNMNAVCFGATGDKVENLLWRITEGKQLDGFQAKVIVLMIGVNNMIHEEKASKIADGILNLEKVICEKQPDAKILLLAVLPFSWDKTNSVDKVNSVIKGSADGKKIIFFDMGELFRGKDGKLINMRDGLHPSPDGYQKMADLLIPQITEMLKD